jgi:hypothetical protein
MRLSRLLILAVLATFLVLPPDPARAAETPPNPKSSPRCGSSADDAISLAEKALASNSADNQAGALACVIEAVKALQPARLDGGSDNDSQRVLIVPRLEARKPR